MLLPLLDVNKSHGVVLDGFIAQVQMVLAYTGMTSITAAHDFAEECATALHITKTIVEQSIRLEKFFNTQSDIDIEFHYLLKGQSTEMEQIYYKELVYCAIAATKIKNPGTSWDN